MRKQQPTRLLPFFFETRFWPAYPKRRGSNPRKPAQKAIEVAIKNGHAPDTIMAGLQRYVAILQSTNKFGSEYVKRAVSWIQEEGWTDHTDVEALIDQSKIVGIPLKPGTPEFETHYASLKPESLQHSLMTRAIDTGQPYFIRPTEIQKRS